MSNRGVTFVPMSKLNVFYNEVKVKTIVDLLDKAISIYSILNYEQRDRLVKHEQKILLYYVKNGLTKKTLEDVCADTNYTKNHLHTVNKSLRDKGYLVRDENNQHKFYLNADLELLRKKFISDKATGFIIKFNG